MADGKRRFPRASGVLLHPTCLPGPDGIGDLGEQAYQMVHWLEKTGQSLWQILPLGPTSYGDSPYQTLSAFAGNPLLICLDTLVSEGWLVAADLQNRPKFDSERVEFGKVINWKNDRLDLAWVNFQDKATSAEQDQFDLWRQQNSSWLNDYALFTALKNDNNGQPWYQWEQQLISREPEALKQATERLEKQILRVCFSQWLFFTQWHNLKSYANEKGIRLIGDLPIFVAHDSSDVWANSQYFLLDKKGSPTSVAGVPPDYFSKTGQLWGNPLYDWPLLKQDGYSWWVGRVQACLDLVDIVRIDHFRGFEACWEVPVAEKTAINGTWVKGPGADLFRVLRQELGELPVIAEDLGVITPAVEKLRDDFELPGMKVLQFAWSGPDNLFLPHEHPRNCIVYSGTHDNDPTIGWWEHLADGETKKLVADYIGHQVFEPHWELIRLGMMSNAHTFIATMQDVLGLGRDARMNLPGEGQGNWNWRLSAGAFENPAADRLAHLTWLYRRRADQIKPDSEDSLLPSSEQQS